MGYSAFPSKSWPERAWPYGTWPGWLHEEIKIFLGLHDNELYLKIGDRHIVELES
jgi:hypothetical protein